MTSSVDVELAPPLARLTLNNPGRRNAMTDAMWRALPATVARLTAERGIKAIILTGAGEAFAAGADISEFARVYATPETTRAYSASIAAANRALADCEKPVIAMIRGACVGGGCGLALAADIRFAEAGAKFGITPSKLGLVYPVGDTKRLVDAVGLSRAKDMLFSGRLMSAEEALSIGLIDFLVPPEELEARVTAYATELAALSQYSIRAMKKVLHRIRDVAPSGETAAEGLAAFEGEDFKEGYRAFLEKRQAKFTYS